MLTFLPLHQYQVAVCLSRF